MFHVVLPSIDTSLTGFSDEGYSDSDAYGRVVADIMKVKEDKKGKDIKKKKIASLIMFNDGETYIDFLKNNKEVNFSKSTKIDRLLLDMLRNGLSEDFRTFVLPKGTRSKKYKIYPIANSYNNSVRESIYIAGKSGSGKSTWMSKYADSYYNGIGKKINEEKDRKMEEDKKAEIKRIKKEYKIKCVDDETSDEEDYKLDLQCIEAEYSPEPKVVMFSRVSEDPAFEKGTVDYINLKSIEDLPFDLDEVENKCCIFDDIDTLDGNIKKQLQDIRNDILQTGRHRNISCLTSSHLMRGGNDTKVPILESHKLVLFPRSSPSHVRDMLRTYGDVNKIDLEKIMAIPGRWITLQKEGIPYVYHENGAFILS